MLPNSIQVKMLFLIALDNGAHKYPDLLKNFSKTDTQRLLDSGLVNKFGEDNLFLEVDPSVESIVDHSIRTAISAIDLGYILNK